MSTKRTRELLNTPFWIESLQTDGTYSRLHDDHDGEFTGKLHVMFDRTGDAYVSTSDSGFLRFRTVGGGGCSERTRTALMILAEAIRLDNESKPIIKP